MSRRRKFLIAGIAVGVAVGYLGYNAFMGAATYYYGVGELLEQGTSVQGQAVRVNGRIGSLEKEQAGVKKHKLNKTTAGRPILKIKFSKKMALMKKLKTKQTKILNQR